MDYGARSWKAEVVGRGFGEVSFKAEVVEFIYSFPRFSNLQNRAEGKRRQAGKAACSTGILKSHRKSSLRMHFGFPRVN